MADGDGAAGAGSLRRPSGSRLRWVALATAGAVVLGGAGLALGRREPAAGGTAAGPPASPAVSPCAQAGVGAGRPAAALPEPVTVAGRLGSMISATAAPGGIVLDLSDDGNPQLGGLRPARLVGLDPETLAVRWRWKFPGTPGPVADSYLVGGDFSDSYLRVVGDIALAVTGGGDPREKPRVYALDVRTGAPRWTLPAPAGSQPTVAYADRCLVILDVRAPASSVNGTLGLWGIDPATGRVIWQDGPARELLCVDPLTPWMYAASGGHLLRYEISTGHVTAVRAPVPPDDACELVHVTGERMVDIGTGRWYTVDWARATSGPAGPGPVRVPPDNSAGVHRIGDLTVIDDNGAVTVCERGSGVPLWQEPGSGRGYFALAGGQPDDRLYFRRHSPFTARTPTVSLSAVDARSGRTLWSSAQLPGTDEFPAVDPRTGAVLVNTAPATGRPHLTYALDGGDGHTLWSVTADTYALAGPWLLAQAGGRLRGYRVS
jgi:outer membrane protein assembly factor BamB